MSKFEKLTKVLAKLMGCSPETLVGNFKPAVEADLEEVLLFRERNLNQKILTWDDRKYLCWRYNFLTKDQNEAGNAKNNLWLLRSNEEIVGILGAQDVPLNIAGKVLHAVHPMDILVEKRLDGAGLGAWMQLALNQTCDLMVVIGANQASRSLVKRMFHPMPDREVWKIPIKCDGFVNKKMHSETLSKTLGIFINPLYSIYRRIRYLRHIDKQLEIKVLDKFTDEVERLSSARQGIIYRMRSANFLNWRFLDKPESSSTVCGIFKDDSLVGYFVYDPENEEKDGSCSARVLDYFWLYGNTYPGDLLLQTILLMERYFREQGVNVIALPVYGSEAITAVKSLGYFNRSGESLFSLSCNVPELQDVAFQSGSWFLTEADAHSRAYDI